jgi:hypothetical protein
VRHDDFQTFIRIENNFFLKEKGMSSSPSKSLRRGYVMTHIPGVFVGEKNMKFSYKLPIIKSQVK